jgi:hypothetical protein
MVMWYKRAAEQPGDEPLGQLFDRSSNPIRRNWPGRLHRVVRRRARCGAISLRQCPSATYQKIKPERGRQRKQKMAEAAQFTG